MMRRKEKLDLPDFLHDDPFLPISGGDDFYYTKQPVKPRPSLKEILKWKRLHHALFLIFGLWTLHFLFGKVRSYHVIDRINGPMCYYKKAASPPSSYLDDSIDWSKYAYAQYATDKEYLCNTVMIFESLHRLGSKAHRVLMYPKGLSPLNDTEYRLLLRANKDYNVSIVPVEIQHSNLAQYAGQNWADSYTKLLAFNQTQYSRIIMLDSDSVILQHMDELFFLPPAPVAMPQAYWLPRPTLGSYFMLIQPSAETFQQIKSAIKKWAGYGIYDMEIMNKLFGDTCLRLPHHPYALLSGEFKAHDHSAYLGENHNWNAMKVMNETKMIHFSDYPLGKPWEATWTEMQQAGPKCPMDLNSGVVQEKCDDREVWFKLYTDFRTRRKEICRFESPR